MPANFYSLRDKGCFPSFNKEQPNNKGDLFGKNIIGKVLSCHINYLKSSLKKTKKCITSLCLLKCYYNNKTLFNETMLNCIQVKL